MRGMKKENMLFSNFEERNWYYPGNYETIIDDRNPANVDTVSMLRHYCNCHGVTKELREYLNMSKERINKIRDYCVGQILISELKKDPERFIFSPQGDPFLTLSDGGGIEVHSFFC